MGLPRMYDRDRKTQFLSLRLTDDEMEFINDLKKSLNTDSTSDVVRRIINSYRMMILSLQDMIYLKGYNELK